MAMKMGIGGNSLRNGDTVPGGRGAQGQMTGARARNGWSDAVVGTDRHAVWTVNGWVVANTEGT